MPVLLKKQVLSGASVPGALSALMLASCVLLSGCDKSVDTNVDVNADANTNAMQAKKVSNTAEQESVLSLPLPNEHSAKRAIEAGAHGKSHDPHQNLSAEKYAQVALQHLVEGRNVLAVDTLVQAVEKYPQSDFLYGVRGSMHLQLGNTSLALADLNKAIDLNPHDPSYFTNRAQTLRKFGRMGEAMTDLESALKLDGTFVAALFNRGSLYFNQGKFDLALADFDGCIGAEPKAAAAYFNRASVHEALGHRDKAVADMQQFIVLANSGEAKDAATKVLEQWQAQSETAAQAGAS